MQTKEQIRELEDILNSFKMTEELENWKPFNHTSSNSSSTTSLINNRYDSLCILLNKIKAKLYQKVLNENSALSIRLLRQLKKEHFSSVESLSELHIKKDISSNILKEYGIESLYLSILTNEAELNLQAKEIKRLSCIIYEKDEEIRKIQTDYENICREKEEIENLYESAKDKICTFKHINGEFLRVTEDYDRERQKNRQNKI